MPSAAVTGWSRSQFGIESRGAGPALEAGSAPFVYVYWRKSLAAICAAGPVTGIHVAAQGTALGRSLIRFRTVPRDNKCA
jgi:hypothetical protein